MGSIINSGISWLKNMVAGVIDLLPDSPFCMIYGLCKTYYRLYKLFCSDWWHDKNSYRLDGFAHCLVCCIRSYALDQGD